MLDRDTVRRRLEGEGISYTEFSYMLLQANDYVELHQRLRVHAADRRLRPVGQHHRRRPAGASERTAPTVHALTIPLVTDSDGKKFGKSTGGGNLWLDPEMTSPYAWYQYFVNTADADVIPYLKWFTFLSADEMAELEKATAERPHERAAQRRLAQEITTLVHGEAALRGGRTRQPGAVRSGELTAARRADAGGGTARGEQSHVAELKPGGPDAIIDLLVASGFVGQQGRRAADGRRGRRLRQQRPDRERRVDATAVGLPPRPVVGASSR